ncbi:MAG TPA: ectoine/hydroxyectoine ABC transporter permease subunit EhuD [Hypericibacter adhaerens]|jgi:polar amino acid transport system permease protein|uniref:Ectoine/hydroxyectoine ABC transporter permease subunit EhuD n=1 Tax=Hypericibacter adhaerens TaxID=2602016 RepID=A0A5J6N839_9PROT|nr:ectoine/hydroxyectoine ABC transporter permease subunit EhuD [Hypericibacter adhaerens]QEX23376.1 ectoine/hydroxyectoine ABC transporter permease subunit EhuD [Hypericibacter adhaerens]HWA45459.1 ectoine/hydroxyectoine ABC transporter permease subunit EhuD [Hypericibacter adhaerens]
MSWDWNFVWPYLPVLLRGTLVTVEATLAGTAIAFAVGILFAIAGQAENRAIRIAIRFTVQFLRGTPLLVQLYVIFFLLPDIGIVLPAFLAGVIGLGLHYACYMSEVFRAGILSVGKGQWDAAMATNLGRSQTWIHIILPQAIPKMIPALGNYAVGMLKEAALLSAISVHELMSRALATGNETYRYTEPLTMAGVIFLIMTIAATLLLKRLEKALGPVAAR